MYEKQERIILDMREHLYDIVAKRMESGLNSYAQNNFDVTFKEMNSLKTIISGEMTENTKRIFDKASERIGQLIDEVYYKKTITKEDIVKKNLALKEVRSYVILFMEMIFKEMSAQKIWFPKGKRYESFDTTMMEDTFGIGPEDKADKVGKLIKLEKEELFDMMTKDMVENLYARHIMKTII